MGDVIQVQVVLLELTASCELVWRHDTQIVDIPTYFFFFFGYNLISSSTKGLEVTIKFSPQMTNFFLSLEKSRRLLPTILSLLLSDLQRKDYGVVSN